LKRWAGFKRQVSAFPEIESFMRENGRANEVEMARKAQQIERRRIRLGETTVQASSITVCNERQRPDGRG
jgi:hypothetical protein